MMPWEQPAPDEAQITDLETARLALRGAVSSLRTLQDINSNLKAELQELQSRERGWKGRVAEMETRLAELNAKWQQAQRTQDQYRAQYAEQIRSEVALEEQIKWQGQLEQIQQTLEHWKNIRDQREI